MNSTRTPAGVNLNYLLTRVIPGSLFIITISTVYTLIFILSDEIVLTEFPMKSELTDVNLLVVFIILSAIFGEIINYIREYLFRAPATFKNLVYNDTKNLAVLGPLQRRREYKNHNHSFQEDNSKIKKIFKEFCYPVIAISTDLIIFIVNNLNRLLVPKWLPIDGNTTGFFDNSEKEHVISDLRAYNDLPSEFDDPNQLYFMLLKNISGNESAETKRARRIYTSYKNMSISIFSSFFTIFLILTSDLIENREVFVVFGIFILISLFLYFFGILLVTIFSEMFNIDRYYTNLTLIEFKIIEEQELNETSRNKTSSTASKSLTEFERKENK